MVCNLCPVRTLNSRITEWSRLEGTFTDRLVQSPCASRVNLKPAAQDRVLMAFEYHLGRRLHNLSGPPVRVFSHPQSKKAFPQIQTELPGFQFVLIASCPVTGTTEKSPAPYSLCSPFRYLHALIRSSLRLLLSKLNKPSSLRIFSYEML